MRPRAHCLAVANVTTSGGVRLASAGSSIRDSESKDFSAVRNVSPDSGAIFLEAAGIVAERLRVFNSAHVGIRILGNNVVLRECEVAGSRSDAVVVGDRSGVRMNDCNLHNNVGLGVRTTGTSTVDATNNWWGDPAGPLGPEGDGVGTYVGYIPFRTARR